MYDPKSRVATEFINDEEILETLRYAAVNKVNRESIRISSRQSGGLQGTVPQRSRCVIRMYPARSEPTD